MRKLLVLALLFAPGVEATYKCTDKGGRTHIGDTPPAQCAEVVMYETSASGTVLRKIDPTPSADEVKAKLAAEEKKKADDIAAGEQRRKDLALMATYTSEKDFDVAAERNLDPIIMRIKSVKERIAAVEKRQQSLEDEMEFYQAGKSKTSKSKSAPPQLVTDLDRVKAEQVTLATNLKNYDKEVADTRARYESDKQRWKDLKTQQAAGKLNLADPKTADSSAKQDPLKRPGVQKYEIYIVPAK
jgi:Domain of unknown function (DUF4124)